jgi:hypothetical protein
MGLEAAIKALKLKMRRIDEAISAMEALAENEIQRRRDCREHIRAGEQNPQRGERSSPDAKSNS